MIRSVSVVYSGDHMADWELLLLAPAQRQESIALHIACPGTD